MFFIYSLYFLICYTIFRFSSKHQLEKHGDLCWKESPQQVQYPKEKILRFKNWRKTLEHPVIIG